MAGDFKEEELEPSTGREEMDAERNFQDPHAVEAAGHIGDVQPAAGLNIYLSQYSAVRRCGHRQPLLELVSLELPIHLAPRQQCGPEVLQQVWRLCHLFILGWRRQPCGIHAIRQTLQS